MKQWEASKKASKDNFKNVNPKANTEDSTLIPSLFKAAYFLLEAIYYQNQEMIKQNQKMIKHTEDIRRSNSNIDLTTNSRL